MQIKSSHSVMLYIVWKRKQPIGIQAYGAYTNKNHFVTPDSGAAQSSEQIYLID